MNDTIVVASLKSFQPWLSESKRSVYTVLTFNVEDVLLKGSAQFEAQNALTVVAGGGSVQLPGGQIISRSVRGSTFDVNPEGRYVLFLRFMPRQDAFVIRKAWELRSGVAVPTSEDDRQHIQQGTSAYNRSVETALLTAVRAAIQQAAKTK